MLDTSNTPSPLNTTPRPDELTSVRKLPVMFGPCPNITGSSNGAVTYGEATSGAIYTPPMTSYRIASDSVSNMSTAGAMTFDASRSSSIYSTKMQPKSLQVLPCIRC